MATKKKMLQAAAGNATGGAGLNVEDVFSTYLYTGNGGSQVIQNGINLGQSFGSGSGDFDGTSGMSATTTPSLFTSDFTIEAFVYLDALISNFQDIFTFANPASGLLVNGSNRLGFYPTSAAATSTFPVGQWVHVAVSRSGSTLKLFQDGAEVASISDSTNYTTTSGIYIGSWTDGASESWAGNISNLRVSNIARYTSAFTAPTSSLSNDSNTTLYLFNEDKSYDDLSSSGLTFTNSSGVETVDFGPFDAAEAGEGGLVWTKVRDQTGDHALMNSESSWLTELASNKTDAEGTTSYVNFVDNSNGYSMNTAASRWNESARDYASWTFRKAPKFFDVVTYTGDGVAGLTVNHSLGGTVGSMFVKCTSHADDWYVYHIETGATHSSFLNTTAAAAANGAYWNNTAPTTTQFTVGDNAGVNANGRTYVAYLFAHNDGDGGFGADGDADIIKCGSFTSTSSTQEIDLGFEPQWVLFKNSTDTQYGEWRIFDTMRGMSETESKYLAANSSDSEATNNPLVTAYSQGFKTDVSAGGSGKTYIYMAIRRGTKVPESATEVFEVFETTNTGTASTIGSMGPSDFILNKRTDASATWRVIDRLRSGSMLSTDSTDAETSASNFLEWDKMGGVFVTTQGAPYITNDSQAHWMWKRAPGFFDVVAYKGSTSTQNISHNLGVQPEMIWIKNREYSGTSWKVLFTSLGARKYLNLNTTDAAITLPSYNGTDLFANTLPTSSVFTVGGGNAGGGYDDVGSSGLNYIAYLFASLDGVSKVGSYTGNGTGQNIECGFSSGARFILIKRTSGADSWFLWDSVRGIVSGNDPYLRLNLTAAETTTTDRVDPYSGGFAVTGSDDGNNKNGETYIFYAIA